MRLIVVGQRSVKQMNFGHLDPSGYFPKYVCIYIYIYKMKLHEAPQSRCAAYI